LERELGALGANENIGENRNGVAPLDHAMDVGERSQELGALDRDLHAEPRSMASESPGTGRRLASRRGCPAAGRPRRTTKLARTRRLFKGNAAAGGGAR